MQYPCGCVNIAMDEGIQKNTFKCLYHKSHAGRGGLAYYKELNSMGRDEVYEREFREALEEMKAPLQPGKWGEVVFEIGAGLGPYCPWLERLGYAYAALEPDVEAAKWLRENRDARVVQTTFEEYVARKYVHTKVSLILAAHVIEHFQDAPAMIRGMYDCLIPGGRALLLIPDDTDPTNPDHLWFFTEEGFRKTLERTGFVDVRTTVKQIMPHEKFIYASAYKPA